MQELLRPAEVILPDSRAAGGHRPDSDVDLMVVSPDEDAVREVIDQTGMEHTTVTDYPRRLLEL